MGNVCFLPIYQLSLNLLYSQLNVLRIALRPVQLHIIDLACFTASSTKQLLLLKEKILSLH